MRNRRSVRVQIVAILLQNYWGKDLPPSSLFFLSLLKMKLSFSLPLELSGGRRNCLKPVDRESNAVCCELQAAIIYLNSMLKLFCHSHFTKADFYKTKGSQNTCSVATLPFSFLSFTICLFKITVRHWQWPSFLSRIRCLCGISFPSV